MWRIVVLLTFALVINVLAEDISFHECGKDKSIDCNVKGVHLSPCSKATPTNPCKLHKGKTYNLAFEYEPGFEADKLEANLYWVNPFNIDVPLPNMDCDGCHSTHCPISPNSENNFSYNLTIAKYFPANKYNVKALLRKDKEHECCFEFSIKIMS